MKDLTKCVMDGLSMQTGLGECQMLRSQKLHCFFFPPPFKVFINKHRWTQAIFLPISRHQNDFLSLESISDTTSEIRNLKLNLLLMMKTNELNRHVCYLELREQTSSY